MATITWDTDVNAPGAAGQILGETGLGILIQTDWDYPGVAQAFGWSIQQVQVCSACGKVQTDVLDRGGSECWDCEDCAENPDGYTAGINTCDHRHTDGTVDCPDCGVTAAQFITAAGEWLDSHDGETAEDPGYFCEEGN